MCKIKLFAEAVSVFWIGVKQCDKCLNTETINSILGLAVCLYVKR
jgi:hypothetical protein